MRFNFYERYLKRKKTDCVRTVDAVVAHIWKTLVMNTETERKEIVATLVRLTHPGCHIHRDPVRKNITEGSN